MAQVWRRLGVGSVQQDEAEVCQGKAGLDPAGQGFNFFLSILEYEWEKGVGIHPKKRMEQRN